MLTFLAGRLKHSFVYRAFSFNTFSALLLNKTLACLNKKVYFFARISMLTQNVLYNLPATLFVLTENTFFPFLADLRSLQYQNNSIFAYFQKKDVR